MIEAATSSPAALIPTGPTVLQAKERASKAGTDGPPPKAVNRTTEQDKPREMPERALAKTDDQGASRSEVMRSALNDQMRTQDRIAENAQDDKRKLRMAKDAYTETQFLTRQADEVRAEKMRIAM